MPDPVATSGIAAEAFQLVELSPISSFADETPQAQDAARYYQGALDLCLERGDWSFASRLVNLPPADLPEGVAQDDDLPYCYALPGDCVMLREVLPKTCAYRLDEGFLRSDQPGPLKIRYTRRITDEAKTSSAFRTAAAHALALKLAPRWLGTLSKRDAIASGLEQAMTLAARPDARTASPNRYDDEPAAVSWADLATR